MLSLEISSIGSACGKNPYESRNKTMLSLICKNRKNQYKEIFLREEIIKPSKFGQKSYDKELKRLYDGVKKNINSPGDFERVKKEIVSEIKSENPEIDPVKISSVEDFLNNSMKKDCGINNENKIVKKCNYSKGNNFMCTYSEKDWCIRGFHDASDNDTVIEIKTRVKFVNIRKNEYDLYQLFGYLLAMGKTKGKIVQYFNKVVYDSDIENNTEYGLIDITSGKWKDKFSKFKEELNLFFEDVYKYLTEDTSLIFDYKQVIDKKYCPICEIDVDGIPNNVNPRFEKIVKNLF